MRQFAVRESLHMEVRAEGFHAMNHSNLGTPNRFANTPQFGTITEAATPGWELQLSARIPSYSSQGRYTAAQTQSSDSRRTGQSAAG